MKKKATFPVNCQLMQNLELKIEKTKKKFNSKQHFAFIRKLAVKQ